MVRKTVFGLALFLCVFFLSAMMSSDARAAVAQNAAPAKSAEAQAKKAAEAKANVAEAEAKVKAESEAQAEKIANAYRLDFSVNELEDGKKINTRQYSMNSRSGDWNEIKIGTRVPVDGKQGEADFQYLDVGTYIRCRLTDRSDMASLGSGDVAVNATADLSNFAMPEQQGQRVQPVIRQLRIQSSTIAFLNKPMVVGVVDDPNSKRQFQLEVTVTRLK